MKTKNLILLWITFVVVLVSNLGACSSNHTHSYITEVVAPTCNAKGYTKYICECGDYYNDNFVDMIEHTYQVTIINSATCSSFGTKKYECACGENYTKTYSLEDKNASIVYEQLKKSVGEVVTYNKNGNELALGTCFVYSSGGEIITNYHVIEDAYSAKITLNNKTYDVIQVLAYDKAVDLAVLKINVSGLNAVTICNKEHAVGSAVYAIGSSKGLTATFSQGIITYANREMDGVHYVQHDAAISSGNSGGPLVNGYGEVIGVNTLTIRDSQNLNFAIMTKEINGLDFSSPLSFAEFYEKETDVFTKLKKYIISRGEYDVEDKEYKVSFGDYYWNDTHNYSVGAIYYLEQNRISLTNFVYKYDLSYTLMTFLDIEKISGVYEWAIIDGSSNYMVGNVYASTFNSSTILSYSTNIGFSSNVYTIREVASQMIYQTLEDMTIDYASIGVKAADLGFYNI